MKYLIHILFAMLTAASFAVSCSSGSSGIDRDLREAEDAAAIGDMAAAQSVAAHFLSQENLSGLSASQLARLSLVYMQIADSTDRENSIAQAADLYRRAVAADPDSAAAVYSAVSPEMYPYVTLLHTLVGHIDHPYDLAADSLGESGHDELPPLSDSLQ